MADIIITLSDPDSGLCTVFESLQLDTPPSESSSTDEVKDGSPQGKRVRPTAGQQRQHLDTTRYLTTPILYEEDLTELKPCAYYRHKFECRENHDVPQNLSYWINYMALKKSAAQKVVNKITSQQKRMAEAAAAEQKRTTSGIFDNIGIVDTADIKSILPPRRKPQRLEPLKLNYQIEAAKNKR